MKQFLLLIFFCFPATIAAAQDEETALGEDSSVSQSPDAPNDKEQQEESDKPEDEADVNEQESDEEPLPPPKSGFMKVMEGIFNSGPLGMIKRGGWFMPPILLLGIIAAGVIIERYRSLKMLGTDSSLIRNEVQMLLNKGQIEEALRLCDNERGSVPAILTCGLRKFFVLSHLKYDAGKIEEQVIKSMDDYSVHIVAQLERHLPILATISSIAPMLGFLGTVSGMINSFNDIVAKMGEINIVSAAADGISEALLTTCFGLIVGIPAFIAYNYFTSVINSFVLEVEESSTELIESVTMQMALEQEAT